MGKFTESRVPETRLSIVYRAEIIDTWRWRIFLLHLEVEFSILDFQCMYVAFSSFFNPRQNRFLPGSRVDKIDFQKESNLLNKFERVLSG